LLSLPSKGSLADFLEKSLQKVLVWREEKWMRHAWQRNWTIREVVF